MITRIDELYAKRGGGADGTPTPEPKPEAVGEKPVVPQAPPGLPAEYVDAILKEQSITQVAEVQLTDKKEVFNHQAVPGVATLCHKDNIPYAPGGEPKTVTDRINQGPRVFLTVSAQKESADAEKGSQTQKAKAAPTPHPDTSKPGRHFREGLVSYRPGA